MRIQMQRHAAHPEAEQGNADHHEGEVVPDGEREDTGERYLEQHDRARQQPDGH
jgi:hypothetical protein